MAPTNAGQKLLQELTAEYGAGAKAAAKAGVKQNQISQWCSGDILPSYANRKKLEELGIPAESWDVKLGGPAAEPAA
jgi:transcriptional regulator with XRE-family HTH domain